MKKHVVALLSFALITINVLSLAQKPAGAAVPIPSQLATAKKVFIGYAGGESQVAGYSGGPDRTYNDFYAALKKWGHWELVSTPAEAELVFEISFASPFAGSSVYGGGGTGGTSIPVTSSSSSDPHFQLTIRDSKTQIILWTVVEHVEFAARHSTRDKNFDAAMAALVNDLARLAGTPPAVVASGRKDEDGSK